jgi:hypothetical protein
MVVKNTVNTPIERCDGKGRGSEFIVMLPLHHGSAVASEDTPEPAL